MTGESELEILVQLRDMASDQLKQLNATLQQTGGATTTTADATTNMNYSMTGMGRSLALMMPNLNDWKTLLDSNTSSLAKMQNGIGGMNMGLVMLARTTDTTLQNQLMWQAGLSAGFGLIDYGITKIKEFDNYLQITNDLEKGLTQTNGVLTDSNKKLADSWIQQTETLSKTAADKQKDLDKQQSDLLKFWDLKAKFQDMGTVMGDMSKSTRDAATQTALDQMKAAMTASEQADANYKLADSFGYLTDAQKRTHDQQQTIMAYMDAMNASDPNLKMTWEDATKAVNGYAQAMMQTDDFQKSETQAIADLMHNEGLSIEDATLYVHNLEAAAINAGKSFKDVGKELDSIHQKMEDYFGQATKNLNPVLSSAAFENMDATLAQIKQFQDKANAAAAAGDTQQAMYWGSIVASLTSQLDTYKSQQGHATGYLSNYPHMANISEGGKYEAVVPLNSNLTPDSNGMSILSKLNIGNSRQNINVNLIVDGQTLARVDAKNMGNNYADRAVMGG